MGYEVRKATLDDRESITRLIAESARSWSRQKHHDDAQIEAAIASVFGVDSDLIEDGTYFVAEQDETLIGCGGWSRRKTPFWRRSVFQSRCGHARSGDRARKDSRLFCSSTARTQRRRPRHPVRLRKGSEGPRLPHTRIDGNFTRVKFYEANGYRIVGYFDLDLADGVKLPLVPMRKKIEGEAL